jgi:hypothetical protein
MVKQCSVETATVLISLQLPVGSSVLCISSPCVLLLFGWPGKTAKFQRKFRLDSSPAYRWLKRNEYVSGLRQ